MCKRRRECQFNSDGFRTHELRDIPPKAKDEIRIIITGVLHLLAGILVKPVHSTIKFINYSPNIILISSQNFLI